MEVYLIFLIDNYHISDLPLKSLQLQLTLYSLTIELQKIVDDLNTDAKCL